jgi:hypothetical protein
MQNEYDTLESFLEKSEIPVIQNPIGFLEIIKKQYHENINSSVYAHFINCSHQQVKELFLNALIEIIEKKSDKRIQMFDAFAQTEITTSTGRLDILIGGNLDSGKILIENKINHWLDNDLLEYWDFVKCPEQEKIGVLLTLNQHEIPENVKGKFINITHREWIWSVKENYNPEDFPINYQVYISDFIQTIENLTKSHKMNEATKFYFQYPTQILKARDTITQAHQFINEQLQYVANEIGWQTYGNSMDWRNFWDEHNFIDTYLTIITKDLLEGKNHFTLILELKRKDKERLSEVKDLLFELNHKQFNPELKMLDHKDYLHFQFKIYTVSNEEMEELGKIIVQKIKEDFADMTFQVIEYLYPEKKENFVWKEKFLAI